MIIEKYGIRLRTVKEEDIELIRVQRNSDEIRSKMHYRKLITPEMQKEWFERMDSALFTNEPVSCYFIIEADARKIGLVNGKNIDFNKKTSEGGIFIWDKEYLGGLVPVMVAIITLDYSFLINDFNSNFIKVIKSNTQALEFNKLLGFSITGEDHDFFHLTLDKNNYLEKSTVYRKILGDETRDYEPLSVDDISLADTTDVRLQKEYPLLNSLQKKIVAQILKRERRNVRLNL